MAMDWLKGLVGPTAQFIPPGQPYPGGLGGVPQAGPPPGGAPVWTPAGPAAAPSAPYQPQPAPLPIVGQQGNEAARIASLEATCEVLRRDLESVALFARTLLTLLQERQIMTAEQFVDTKNKLDMLDGKLDDRIASGR